MNKEILKKMHSAKRNLIVAGDMATGKTTGVLFPLVDKMIEQNESLMILDSKEEYIHKYYNQLKNKDYNMIVLNLKDLEKSEGWNPLQIAYELYINGNKDKAMDYLEKIGKTMFYEDSSADPFWSSAASDLFTGVVLGLFEDAKKDEIHLNSVNMMFEGINQKNGIHNSLANYFKLKDPKSQSYICASTTILAPRETRESIIAVAKQKLKLYVSREKLNVFMNKTTFNYEDIANKKTAIFFIAKDDSKYLNPIAAMFIEQLFTILLDMKRSNKFNFVLDNFDIIENINEFTSMLSSCISENMKFVVATRSLNDLLNKYGSYITKLSNQIYTADGLARIKINDKEETFENQYQELEFDSGNVDYPKLNVQPIQIFNLKEFIEKNLHKLPQLSNSFTDHSVSTKPLEKNTNIDDLIKIINDKIEKLEAQEKMNNKNK